jgi:hypothetical protein
VRDDEVLAAGFADHGESSTIDEICAASPGTKLITPGGSPAASSSRTM